MDNEHGADPGPAESLSASPLDYARPSPSGTRGWDVAGGVMIGVVVTATAGFGVAVLIDESTPSAWDLHSRMAAAAFFAAAAVALVVFFHGIRDRVRRKWFFLSFAIGAGTMALVEGACFMQ